MPVPVAAKDRRIVIFDTTLRDGEQSPGASMNLEEKLQMAEVLCQLNVDVIEAGFPASSEGDFQAVRAISELVDGPTLAALSRCRRDDIIRTHHALRSAKKKRAHLFLATSPIHRQYKLKMSEAEVMRCVRESLEMAAELFDEVEFSAEDAVRTEPGFLLEVLELAIAAGATVINIPDTVGYAVPSQIAGLIRLIQEKVPGIEKTVLSVHCHNDLGLALANSLAAIEAGAGQVECTVNGIGERAGNCALEELVMALRTRSDHYGCDTGIHTRSLYYASQMLARLTGLSVQRNKAVVGANAFAHEAGIHQHGMLMHPSTYEIMRAEDVGQVGQHLVLGKHSGRHAFHFWLEERRIFCTEMQFEEAFNAFKRLCDQKKNPEEHELLAIVRDLVQTSPHPATVPLRSLSR